MLLPLKVFLPLKEQYYNTKMRKPIPLHVKYHYYCILFVYMQDFFYMVLSIVSYLCSHFVVAILYYVPLTKQGWTGSGSSYAIQILALIFNHCMMLGKILGPYVCVNFLRSETVKNITCFQDNCGWLTWLIYRNNVIYQ